MAGNEPKLYKWGPKGPLVAKETDPETFIEKKDLGILGGPNSDLVKKLPGYEWRATGMAVVKGGSLAKNSDVQALFTPPAASAPPVKAPTAPTPEPVPAPPAKPITSVIVESTSSAAQTNVPITFGQVFAPGDLPAGQGLTSTVPLQLDVKALHPDGSVRHAVISAVLPALAAGEKLELPLVKVEKPAKAKKQEVIPTASLALTVRVTLDGKIYTVERAVGQAWLNGELALELGGSVPLQDDNNQFHPHLSARLALRWYETAEKARFDVAIENNWAYEPNPQNFTYDVEISTHGKIVYAKKGLTHYHHARWRHVFWIGEEPQVHIRHNIAYLIASRALPNYDQSVVVSEKLLAKYAKEWTGVKIEPMGIGLAAPVMPGPGGRRDIGLLPEWGAAHLLSMDPRAAMVNLGTADLAGSWTMHYRDKNTGYPISLLDYPYMTIYGSPTDTKNPDRIDPATKKKGVYEAFPKLPKGAGGTGHDSAHQPGLAYLPYLLTGDYYYLEELHFWAMWNVFQTNPGYRKNVQGLLTREQVRGQAWSMRTLGQAAYITPDSHPLKNAFATIVGNNLAAYHAEYITNPNANKLGVVTHGNAVVYDIDDPLTEKSEEDNAIGVFQDEHFTSSMAYLARMGFAAAEPLVRYKVQFAIGRLVGEGVNWQAAAAYAYKIRNAPGEPFYETIGEAFRATVGPKAAAVYNDDAAFAKARGTKLGDLGGYSNLPTGFPANLQPAAAAAADYGGEPGRRAWAQFMARSVKPDYSLGPQFAIVPR